MGEFQYAGKELAIFARAIFWKKYWSSRIKKFISGDVLEVGAGIGMNTCLLRHLANGKWICLEPDQQLVAQLKSNLKQHHIDDGCEICSDKIAARQGHSFDTILYIDVLEHIENDKLELQQAAALLKPGGYLVVVAPAHQRLYTEFDRSIGHFRRYTKQSLRLLTPDKIVVHRVFYLDAVGILASLANRFWLHQELPKLKQVEIWDRFMIPLSRIIDPIAGYNLGKTVVVVWKGNQH
jgi:2-polyprenyl-3-methyl-5-hydroxy-6-metoxy-1,4-benzoquinol methylase